MKYGLEQEFFVARLTDDKPIFVGGLDRSLTPDECGFLAEARGQPHDNIREAVFSLLADVHRLECAAEKLGLKLMKVPNADVPEAEILKSRRMYGKGVLTYQNLYGHEAHRNGRRKTAGIHISFTEFEQFHYTTGKDCPVDKTFTYQPLWDFVQVFRKLDLAFKDEIRTARRNPGFYELKSDGRIEYRSLPNDVDLMKIIKVLE